MISQLLQPSRDVLVGLVFADIIDEQSANSTSIISGCDSSISLLPCGIPDLCLDCLCVYLDRPGRELYTDCGLGVEIEFVACESAQQVGFSDTRVSDQDHWGNVSSAGEDVGENIGGGVPSYP